VNQSSALDGDARERLATMVRKHQLEPDVEMVDGRVGFRGERATGVDIL
jgi:hypothetical protein